MINSVRRTWAGLGLLIFFFGLACQPKEAVLMEVGTANLPLNLSGSSAKIFGQVEDTMLSFFEYSKGQSVSLTRGEDFKSFHNFIIPNALQFRVYSYHVQSLDSLLLHEAYVEYNKLTWVEPSGNVLQSNAINAMLPEIYDTYTRPATPLLYADGKALVYFGRNMDPEFYRMNVKSPLGLWVQLDSSAAVCDYSEYPEIYHGDAYLFNTSHNRPFTTQLGGDTVLWAFHATSELKVYKGCVLLNQRNVPSKYIDAVPAFPMAKYGIKSAEVEFGHSSAAYWRVYYNPWQKLIYRINFPEQLYINNDGTFNLHENRPFTIQVINTDLELIAEKLIETPLNFQAAFAGPKGLYVKNQDENTNKYLIFSIVNR